MLRLKAGREKAVRGLIAAILLAAILVFADLFVLSRSAALIFNHAMADQTMLRGTVTVEKLHANILGEVRFEKLEWKDAEGNTILFVPRGSFRARPYARRRRAFDGLGRRHAVRLPAPFAGT